MQRSLRRRTAGLAAPVAGIALALSACGAFNQSSAEGGINRDEYNKTSVYLTPASVPAPVKGGKKPAGSTATWTYTVVPGDSFYRIARRLKCKPEKILQANEFDSFNERLSVGQPLKMPPSCKQSNIAVPPSTQNPRKPGTYTVKKGDSLYGIANKLKVKPNLIIKCNPEWGGKAAPLFPGMVINTPSRIGGKCS